MSVDRLRRLALVSVLMLGLTFVDGAASGGNPWRLRCTSMPREQRVPPVVRPAFARFFPWVRPDGREALRSGPVYLLALSSHTAISRDGDERDGGGYYNHRALIAIRPSYQDRLTLTGRRLGRPGRRTSLQFSISGASHCTVSGVTVDCAARPLRFASALHFSPRRGWRIVETELRIGRTGCFRLTATGPHLHATIPLAIPGPDWGTPGW